MSALPVCYDSFVCICAVSQALYSMHMCACESYDGFRNARWTSARETEQSHTCMCILGALFNKTSPYVCCVLCVCGTERLANRNSSVPQKRERVSAADLACTRARIHAI